MPAQAVPSGDSHPWDPARDQSDAEARQVQPGSLAGRRVAEKQGTARPNPTLGTGPWARVAPSEWHLPTESRASCFGSGDTADPCPMARMRASGEPGNLATVMVAVFHGQRLGRKFATRLALMLRASGDRCCHGFILRTADGWRTLRCWSGDAARLGREIGQTADAHNIVVSGNIVLCAQKTTAAHDGDKAARLAAPE